MAKHQTRMLLKATSQRIEEKKEKNDVYLRFRFNVIIRLVFCGCSFVVLVVCVLFILLLYTLLSEGLIFQTL